MKNKTIELSLATLLAVTDSINVSFSNDLHEAIFQANDRYRLEDYIKNTYIELQKDVTFEFNDVEYKIKNSGLKTILKEVIKLGNRYEVLQAKYISTNKIIVAIDTYCDSFWYIDGEYIPFKLYCEFDDYIDETHQIQTPNIDKPNWQVVFLENKELFTDEDFYDVFIEIKESCLH